MLKVYRTSPGAVVERDGRWYQLAEFAWDELFTRPALQSWLGNRLSEAPPITAGPGAEDFLAPIGSQEVWAAGVTYVRSRTARMEEAAAAGGGDFYDRVYAAPRPELFFKATPHRVVGPGQCVRIRSDSQWNVPEPELTLCVNAAGQIFGYTIGNDMSSRDIEGENPLYLPQAKVYDGSCALGPGILIQHDPLSPETEIRLSICRDGQDVFAGVTSLSQMKRTGAELVEYLFRQNSFPSGCLLLTGTGIVPPNDFSLQHGDSVRITIQSIGTLENRVD